MSIRSDSYSSVAEVTAFTRHLLEGNAGYSNETRPTLSEVEKMIDRASGQLNLALAGAGFSIPITQAVAKLACDDWVSARATEYVEMTQRGVGYSDGEGSRTAYFRNLSKGAREFVDGNRLGFAALGVSVSSGLSDGLQFTGMDSADQRSDPDDSTLEQPRFTRRLFDNSETESEE